MKVRLTFRSEIYLEGETMEDITNQWMFCNLFDEDVQDCCPEVVEVVSVEDEETYEDLMHEFIEAC